MKERATMRDRRGMTLIEMLIAITVFSVILGAALGLLSKQSKGLDQGSNDMNMLQNLTFSGSLLEEEIRMAGANVPYKQPAIVYAGTNSFIFSADYASNTDSLYTVYYNPGLPSGQVNALTSAQRFALSGTSPSFSYPDSNYFAAGNSGANSPAETLSWFFQLDTSTVTPTNDYLLLRQVNNQAPEVVIRNVLQTTGRNFFRYYYKRIPPAGTSQATLDTVPTAWMPLKHTFGVHGAVADSGPASRIDSLAAVEVAFTVSNGQTGTALRTRSISFMIPMPNIGTKKVTSCGDLPLFGSSLTAAWNVNTTVTPPDTTMVLTWNQAIDETGGESDVQAYVIWRRLLGATVWPEAMASVPAGSTTPSFVDHTAIPGTLYQYAVAAQDCTPSLSTMSTATPPALP
jgi:prepilin-type N-terminal cleavage/methylation domain-containing protein